jgi:hypothetical protein
MSQITQLASGAITAADTITVELIEADETPAVVIVRWPVKPTVLHPRPVTRHSRHGRETVR